VNDGTVRLAQAGDRDGLNALMSAAWPRAFRLAYGVLGNRESAEDVAQDALLTVHRTLRGLRDVQSFDAWLSSIVVRAAVRAAKSAKRQRHEALEDFAALLDGSGSINERLDLANAMRRCTPLERAVLQLAALGYTSAEIGKMVAKPPGTVRYHLSVARSRLRDAVDTRDEPEPVLPPGIMLHHA
jgi:RNA polymerase sigma-70 factor (ECF subfamily)